MSLLKMNKNYDDSNWREEYKGYTNNKRYIELLENGPKSLSQAWLSLIHISEPTRHERI